MLSSFHCHAYEKMIQWIIFECRALREDDPKEKSELSALSSGRGADLQSYPSGLSFHSTNLASRYM